jgi:hypothetical protein
VSEFGHTGKIIGGAFVDTWGDNQFVMRLRDKAFRFSDSDRFGPLFERKNGTPLENQNAPQVFWATHKIWRDQGRRVAEDGVTCVWDQPPPPRPTYIRKVGRQWWVVQNGDEGGSYIRLASDEEPPA